MGDSNTRYQYLSLAMLLSSGAYPREPEHYRVAASFGFNVCNEATVRMPNGGTLNANRRGDAGKKDFDLKWKLFYNQSNALLHGHEACECDRHHNMENRWFERGGTRLAYLAYNNGPHIKSTVSPQAWAGGFSDVRRMAAEQCSDLANGCGAAKANVVASTWDGVVARLQQLLKAGDTLVLGMGPWFIPQAKHVDTLREFMHKVKNIVGPSGHAIFKSCTLPCNAARPLRCTASAAPLPLHRFHCTGSGMLLRHHRIESMNSVPSFSGFCSLLPAPCSLHGSLIHRAHITLILHASRYCMHPACLSQVRAARCSSHHPRPARHAGVATGRAATGRGARFSRRPVGSCSTPFG